MNLLTQSFWRDEAFTGLLVRHNPVEIVKLTMHDSTPPFYYLALWLWSQVFGNGEVGLRLLSVVFWIGAAVIAWLIAKELKISKSWLVGVLLLTQPLVVIYAFEARAYEQLLFLTALSLYLFLIKKRTEQEKKPSFWINIFLVLSLTAALYTHLFGAWVVLVLLGWAVMERLKWVWLVIPLGLFLPWIPVVLNFSKNGGALPYVLDWKNVGLVLVAVGTPLVTPVLFYLFKLKKDRYFWEFLAFLVIPIAGAALYTKVREQYLFQPRFLIETVVPMVVLIGLIVKQRFGIWVVGGLAVLQIAMAVFLFNQQRVTGNGVAAQLNFAIATTHKSPFRELSQYVNNNQVSGDRIINMTPLTYLESHYYGLDSIIYNPGRRRTPTYLGSILIDESDDVAVFPKTHRVWAISSREGGGEPYYIFPGKLVWRRDYGTLNLSLYDED